MSLLLDALKRAEEAKRAKLSVESAPDRAPSSAAASQSMAEIGDAESAASREAERVSAEKQEALEFHLEDYKEYIPAKVKANPPPSPTVAGRTKPAMDAPSAATELSIEDFPETKPGPGVTPPKLRSTSTAPVTATVSGLDAARSEAQQSRDSARNVFVAKQSPVDAVGTHKKWLLPVIAIVLLAVGGGGWFVWNEVKRLSRPGTINVIARPAPTLAPALPGTGQPGARPQDADAQKPPPPAELPLPPLLPPPAEIAPLPKLARITPVDGGPRLTERELLAKSLKDAAVAKEAPIKLQLAQAIEIPVVNSELIEAYAALKSANYPKARALYARLAVAEPLNPDVHLGMATVLARGGDPAAAARSYRQVLVIDPRNGAALAGLLAVNDARSPALETELRTLIARHPETSSLHFTLGNLHASERRWVEAQQSYFEAYRLESDNADYLYNLAVSLDHLKQTKLAHDYYQKALDARPRSGGQFDAVVVARRIKELAPEPRTN